MASKFIPHMLLRGLSEMRLGFRDAAKFSQAVAEYLLFGKTSGPLYVCWEITYDCNKNCDFCTNKQFINRKGSLGTEEALEVIDELSKTPAVYLSLSGGEPLTRKDLPQLLRHAKTRGLHTNVNTNGLLLGYKSAETLCESGLESVTISVQAKKDAEKILGNAKTAFSACEKKGLPVPAIKARAIVSLKNLEEIRAIVKISKKLGIQPTLQPLHPPLGKNRGQPKSTRAEKETFETEWNKFLGENHELNNAYYSTFPDFLFSTSAIVKKPCPAGTFYAHIDSEGNVFSCLERKSLFGKVKNGFAKAWAGDAARKFSRRLPEKNCECWYYCTGPAAVQMELLNSLTGKGRLNSARRRQLLDHRIDQKRVLQSNIRFLRPF